VPGISYPDLQLGIYVEDVIELAKAHGGRAEGTSPQG